MNHIKCPDQDQEIPLVGGGCREGIGCGASRLERDALNLAFHLLNHVLASDATT